MKDVIKYIETEKKNYPICMNLNVIEEIQEKYETLDDWIRIVDSAKGGMPKLKDLKVGLTEMINEAIDIENEKNNTNEPLLTEKQVGRILSEIGLEKLLEVVESLVVDSTKVDDLPKNEQSTRMMVIQISRGFYLQDTVYQVFPKKKQEE